ncbi:MAG: TolC family protein [Proteobacteria bacterium]|nr:TolC family protein [Pseudomonadota bacterium]
MNGGAGFSVFRRVAIKGIFSAAAIALAVTVAPRGAVAQEPQAALSPAKLLDLIKTNGKYAFAAAAADIDAAQARLEGALSDLHPTLTGTVSAKRFESTISSETRNSDVISTIELVQPIYDFGQTYSRVKAARSNILAAEERLRVARNIVLLEGLAVFFNLHTSDLAIHSLNQAHAQAYVRWNISKERLSLGRTDAIDVAEKLALVEQTRLTFYRQRSLNGSLRLRLEDLTGTAFTGEMVDNPKPPASRPKNVDTDKIIALAEKRNPEIAALTRRAEALAFERDGTAARPRIEAFGNLVGNTREAKTRDDWAFGARLTVPFYDGGAKEAERSRLSAEHRRVVAELDVRRRALRRQIRQGVIDRNDSWQQIIAARAELDVSGRRLAHRQRLYEQERVADLGTGMIDFSKAEAILLQAIGAFYVDSARLATMIGEGPARGMTVDFLAEILGTADAPDEQQFTPKEGSGFGQRDQDKFK